MVGQGRPIGIVLIVAGLAVAILSVLWAGANNLSGGSTVLCGGIGALIGLALAGGGVYFFLSGQSETRQFATVEQEKRVLNTVTTRGQIMISELAIDMGISADQVKKYVYDLVGKGLFTGYVDWKAGKLVSQEASQLQGRTTCPNCGGQLELAGKGLIKCPYCGAEIFL
jgi:DNA-directed RNA polymerase subunit RPC12/RpoP